MFVNQLFLGHAFTTMLVYIWSRRNPYFRLNFFGLINFQAPYLPWVLLGFSLILGNSVIVDIVVSGRDTTLVTSFNEGVTLPVATPPVMSFSSFAPLPPFLPAQGRPPVPWPQWFRMFETFLLASVASDFTPERRKALLLQSLGIEGQHIFFTLPPPPPPGSATETDEVKKLAAAPSSYDQAVAASQASPFILREPASSCSFVAMDDSLRDQFMEGISSENLREHLLLKGHRSLFPRAVLLAQQLEQAAQQDRELVPGHVQQLTSRGRRFPRGSTRPRSAFMR
ncbi:hypothetical protein HPB52_023149 [Rhipicephalus sanguineus]|uniref:Derlin n=1 Tax=Rhipicephalus sanguineus TaxID=34632 RepID=A0A9D4Q0K9_RHISA|nr:hypothetical protein HPB52_023149 [Rhipicephalus sanguineus]